MASFRVTCAFALFSTLSDFILGEELVKELAHDSIGPGFADAESERDHEIEADNGQECRIKLHYPQLFLAITIRCCRGLELNHAVIIAAKTVPNDENEADEPSRIGT